MQPLLILATDDRAAQSRQAMGSDLGGYLRTATADPVRMFPLWQAFSGGEPVRADDLRAATSAGFVAGAMRSELLLPIDVDDTLWLRATVCIVPVAIAGELVWVASDFPWHDRDPEAVSGPGAATATLRSLIPDGRYERIADVGCGSGALGVALVAGQGTLDAIDLNSRAVALTELTAALNEVQVRCRIGDFTAGLEGPYDLIACNPPFVLGRPSERTLFHDAQESHAHRGLAHELAPLLKPEGLAAYLTNWTYGPSLPDPLEELAVDLASVMESDLIIIERALVTVADYVRVWTDDSALAERWVASMTADGITHVGTGLWCFGVRPARRRWPSRARTTQSRASSGA